MIPHELRRAAIISEPDFPTAAGPPDRRRDRDDAAAFVVGEVDVDVEVEVEVEASTPSDGCTASSG